MKAFAKIVTSVIIFGVTMVGMTILCCAAWDRCLAGRVYWNSDDMDGGGYLNPGRWVGSSDGFPVVTVNQIVPTPSMSHPDELKIGWTVRRLLCVWWSLFALSMIVSMWLAALAWVKIVPAAKSGASISHSISPPLS